MSRNQECRCFEERIQNQLDQRMPLTADPWIVNHAQTCSSCAELLSDYQVFLLAPIATHGDGNSVPPAVRTTSRKLQARFAIPVQKLIWSIGPTFAALLVVVVSISLNERQTVRLDRSLFSPEVFATNVHSVAVNRHGQHTAPQTIGSSSFENEDSFLAMTRPSAIRQCLYDGVVDYSSSAYQFARAATNLDRKQLLSSEWIGQAASPIEWLDVTASSCDAFLPPPVRHLLTIGIKFLHRSFSLPTEPDLGFSRDLCIWKHAT